MLVPFKHLQKIKKNLKMTAKEFLAALPSKINNQDFKEVSTTLHFDFHDEQYTIDVKEGVASFHDGLDGEPEVVITAKADDFAKIASGDTNPMMAMMMGKLRISNPGAMMKYAKMLGIM